MRTRPLLLLLMLVACDPPPGPSDGGLDAGGDAALDGGGSGTAPCSADAGDLDAGGSDGLTNVCARGLVMSGFGLRFDDGAHALSRLSVYPRIGADQFPDGCEAGGVHRGAVLVAELRGDDERSPGTVTVDHHAIGVASDPPLDAGPGGFSGIRVARGTALLDLVGGAEARTPALFDLSLSLLADAPEVAVVLDGIELETDVAQPVGFPADVEPAQGFPSRGLEAFVEGITRDGDDLRFEVGGRFALGRGDGGSLNSALATARATLRVHYAIVGLERAPMTGSVTYEERHFGHADREHRVCRPPAEQTELSISGHGLTHAAPALTRFSLDLFADQPLEGDRLRELSVRVSNFSWDGANASMRVEGFASNAGPPAPRLPMDYAVRADVALLEWSGTARSRPITFVAPLVDGRVEVALPLE